MRINSSTKRAFLALLVASGAAASAHGQSLGAGASQAEHGPNMRSVKIQVWDFKRSIEFYTALGMKVGPDNVVPNRKPGSPRQGQELVWDAANLNSGITMVSRDYAQRTKMRRGGTVIIMRTPDIDAAIDRLKAAGFVDLPKPRSVGAVSIAMIDDPDGNTVELVGPQLSQK